MPKTIEELNKIKQEYEALNDKISKLTDDELKVVIGGVDDNISNQEFGINRAADDEEGLR